MKLNNKAYDILKWVCLVVIPAACTLLVTLNTLWGWGLPIDAIVGTITAITTFVGMILGISSEAYKRQKTEVEKWN